MPTTFTESIGDSRDYSSPSSWEAATATNLVSLDEVRIGEAYDDRVYNSNVAMSGATTDSTRFRGLRAASGHEYDPIADDGFRNENANAFNNGMMRLHEDFTFCEDALFRTTNTSTTQTRVFRFRTAGINNVEFRNCVADALATTATDTVCFSSINGSSTANRWDNCIALGSGGTDGPNIGFNSSRVITASNCLAWEIHNASSSGTGFNMTNSGVIMENCLSFSAGFQDFDGWGTETTDPAPLGADYCGSTDNTTSQMTNGLSGLNGEAQLFDPSNNDFHPQIRTSGDTIIGAGTNPSMESFEPGVDHGDRGSYNMGPYDSAIGVLSTGASVNLSGSVTKETQTSTGATLNLSGGVTKQPQVSHGAGLQMSGSVTRETKATRGAQMFLSGAVPARAIGKQVGASMNLSGATTKHITHSESGSVNLSGSVTKKTFRQVAGAVLTISGTVTSKAISDVLVLFQQLTYRFRLTRTETYRFRLARTVTHRFRLTRQATYRFCLARIETFRYWLDRIRNFHF